MAVDDAPGNEIGLRFGPIVEAWLHVCVDMQRMFAEATPWTAAWMPRVLPNVVRLAERGPEHTLFTRFVPPPSADDAGGTWHRYYLRWPMMTLDQLEPGLLELVPELAAFAPPARVLDKRVYSPWFEGRLAGVLRELAVDTLIVSGTETEVCVLATVLGAIDHGYRVIVVTDAICSSADPTHDAMLGIYQSRFGMQVETIETMDLLGELKP